jgi:glycosyltransferase involved in cell wall biosynthesis
VTAKPKGRFLVAHPLAQHSHQLSAALSTRKMLGHFFTGLYQFPEQVRLMPDSIRARFQRRFHTEIAHEAVQSFWLGEIAYRMVAGALPRPLSTPILDFYYQSFDWWVARNLTKSDFDVLIGYETSSLRSFESARKFSALCVLDAASVHYAEQRRAYPRFPNGSFWRALDDRKQREIALSDHILALSSYAKDSYVSAGINPTRISVVPLGIDPIKFPYVDRDFEHGKLRILYVGAISEPKGVDLLVAICKELSSKGIELELTLAGSIGFGVERSLLNEPFIRFVGYLSHNDLFVEMANSHIGVFPSRFDGFGQVVLEAMSTGLPVIASSHVGAKDFIQHGESGWIFESGNKSELAELLAGCSQLRHTFKYVGLRAADAVKNQTWEKYREDVVQVLSKLRAT